ncbi:MAG: PAS domain S-box protein [Treponema sp.]|nr:PAS domain S-box protein [Treponema sp.]
MSFLSKIFKKSKSPVLTVKDDSNMPSEQDLVRAGALLAREKNFKDLVSSFVEHAQDIVRADLSAFYVLKDPDDKKSDLKLYYKRGRYTVPDIINGDIDLINFLRDCKEALIFNNKFENKQTAFVPVFLKETLINPQMKSAMALPIVSPPREIGVLFVASQKPLFFNKQRFHFLDCYTKLAAGVMQTSKLFDETRESSRKIDSLERYQENVFNSMTNMVVTTDAAGHIYYFNEPAAQSMGLKQEDLGRNLDNVFKNTLSANMLKTIKQSLNDGNEVLGIEGIYRGKESEIDYSLNVSPLKTPRGKKEGLTLLFTNQTREKELKQTVQAVSDERRIIKDMFARYMSSEVMEKLMETPDNINLGGDKRIATVFFADIRGYTSFSEGREPEEIIEILNEYFSEAVEQVVKYRGYIDKFIGDCIMAVWGVPMMPEKDDAYNAVSCALAIQEIVKSAKRKFFRKGASNLRIGIGINSGPLVAGNLGSLQRMDYSVIGDTVNLAARLEGVSGPEEVIISHETYNQLNGKFEVEERPAVRVKGKEKPIRIYNVVGLK